jgi:PAS domain S-box-containing protein
MTTPTGLPEKSALCARGQYIRSRHAPPLRKDGRVVPVEARIRAIRDREGQPVGFQGICRDITARKQAEGASQQSHTELERRVQERTAELAHANAALQQEIANRIRAEHALQHERHSLQVTLASIRDAVIATDTTATLTFINPVAETLTGWTAREAVGRNITEVFHIVNEQTRQTVDNPVQKVLREGKVVGLANHTVLIARDGREVPIADSGRRFKARTARCMAP